MSRSQNTKQIEKNEFIEKSFSGKNVSYARAPVNLDLSEIFFSYCCLRKQHRVFSLEMFLLKNSSGMHPGLVAWTSNPATLEEEYRNSVRLIRVRSNIPSAGECVVSPSLFNPAQGKELD